MIKFFVIAIALPASAASTAAPRPAAAEIRMLQRCRAGVVDIDALLAEPAALKEAQAMGPLMLDLPYFVACRGLSGQGASCEAFAPGEFSDVCRNVQTMARFAGTVLKSKDVRAACQRGPASPTPGLKPDAAARVCEAFASGLEAGRPEMICPVLEAEGVKSGGATCPHHQAFWNGKPEACRALKDPAIQRECLVLAPLVAGFHDPALCKESPFCGALTGRGARKCDVYKAAVSRAVCAQAAKVLPAVDQADEWRRKEEAAVKKKAEEALAAEAEKKRAEAVKAKAAANKKQFRAGEPMQNSEAAIADVMRKLERGEGVPKPARKPAAPPETTSAVIPARAKEGGVDAKK